MLDTISRRKMTRRRVLILSAIGADVTVLDNHNFFDDMKMLTILMYKTASLHMTWSPAWILQSGSSGHVLLLPFLQ